MLSRIYEGRISHSRRQPAHAFDYACWFAYVDLEEINEFCALSSMISLESLNFISFHRSDYLPGKGSIRKAVIQAIHTQTGENFSGRVFLLTGFRQFGYVMNPLSLFYCFNRQGELQFVAAEVRNTPWDERHTYVLRTDRQSQSKQFHVSPFMPMDLKYNWNIGLPGDQLNLEINLVRANEMIFNANLTLQAKEPTRAVVKAILFRHGWQSLKTLFRIYFQAFLLWRKKAPVFRHPGHGKKERQRGLFEN